MFTHSKRDLVFLVLAGIFITNAVTAELIGGKLIQIGPFVMSIGIIPWPIVFLTTDLINEYYGKSGVRKLSIITACLIAYAFVILFFSIRARAAEGISTVSDEQFRAVFGQSLWIIAGSIIAFLLSQFLDVFIFWLLRNKTGEKMLWLRSTGSTIVSQLADTFVVAGIGLYLASKFNNPLKPMSFDTYINIALTGYTAKLILAVALTPLIYLGHWLVDRYIGHQQSEELIEKTAQESLSDNS
jgi:uncharacterized integral membrane protein (TIGR00697 family)